MASPSRAPPTGVPRRTHLPSSHSASTRTRPTTNGSGTATPEGSLTTTITSLPTQPDGLVLRLRGAHEPQISETTETETGRRRHIQWAEGVIDNEGLGRKKSKVCCIYHKTRDFGESSSEENSDGSSSSSDDESGDDGAARPVGGYARGGRGKGKGKGRKHELEDGNGCDGHGHGHGHDGEKGKRKPSPNAYERMPRYDVKPLHGQPGT